MMNVLLLLAAFCFMEFVAWSNHKYIMHGFLWKWHKDHHRKDNKQGMPLRTEDKHFEKNDLFFIVYALPAIVLMVVGFSIDYMPFVFIGIGITLYGMTYFYVHDIIIHHRIPFIKYSDKHNSYIEAVLKAHEAHHKPRNKADFNNYGLLIFSSRYFKKK